MGNLCCSFNKNKKSSKPENEVIMKEIIRNSSKTDVNPFEPENFSETLNAFDNETSDKQSLNKVTEVGVKRECSKDIGKNEDFEENENNVKHYSNFPENICDIQVKTRKIRSVKDEIDEKRKEFFASLYENIQINNEKVKKANDVAKEFIREILDTVLSKIILEVEMHNELINELVGIVLSNAIRIVSDEKNAIEELINEFLNELLNETMPGIFQSVIWKPLGFANPRGYCYLNSVVQVLGSCEDFKNDIYLHNLNTIEKTKDSIFVEGLFDLIKAIRKCNKKNLNNSLDIVQQNITESSFGDDVYKCFMNLLTRVSNVIKTDIERPPDHYTSLPITCSEKAKANFTRFKTRNPGFVFDNFYGQLTFQTVCKICNHICNESFQMIKSLPLPVPNSNNSETLSSCVDLFFNESDVEVDEPMTCTCESKKTTSLKSISKLTHGPKYLFIYLNRGSYTDDGVKNNTNVTCDNLTIDIKTLEENQSIKYDLISVIDHIGDSAYGHYYCKCSFESEQWWLLNDSQVDRIKNKNDVVTKNTIVFLFKKT